MAKRETITQFIERHIGKYPTKEDFKKDLDRMILDLQDDKASPNQLAFYKRVRSKYNKQFEDTRRYVCSNCGGGFKHDEMVFGEDNDLCTDCAN